MGRKERNQEKKIGVFKKIDLTRLDYYFLFFVMLLLLDAGLFFWGEELELCEAPNGVE